MPWIYSNTHDLFLPASKVAIQCPENSEPYLYKCPASLAESHKDMLLKLSVRETFEARNCAKALASLPRDRALNADEMQFALSLSILIAADTNSNYDAALHASYLPSEDGWMRPSKYLYFNDTPWLDDMDDCKLLHQKIDEISASKLQVKSRRASLLMSSGTVQCPKGSSLKSLLSHYSQDESIFSAFAEMADLKGARMVHCIFDDRRFGVESLLETRYASCQGKSLVLYTDAALTPSDIMTFLMVNELQGHEDSKPFRGVRPIRRRGGGCRPFRGPGLCSTFLLGDCVQILTGGQLLFVEPFSTDHDDDKDEEEDNGQCRSYSFVGTNMIQKFKDQFEVFTSLPFVDSLKQELHGTIVRIAYRHAVNVDEEDEEKKEDEKPWNRTYTAKIFCDCNMHFKTQFDIPCSSQQRLLES